jgi:hypothetical protein
MDDAPLTHPTVFAALVTYPAKSRIYPRAPEAKVFWFFSSEKNIFFASFL